MGSCRRRDWSESWSRDRRGCMSGSRNRGWSERRSRGRRSCVCGGGCWSMSERWSRGWRGCMSGGRRRSRRGRIGSRRSGSHSRVRSRRYGRLRRRCDLSYHRRADIGNQCCRRYLSYHGCADIRRGSSYGQGTRHRLRRRAGVFTPDHGHHQQRQQTRHPRGAPREYRHLASWYRIHSGVYHPSLAPVIARCALEAIRYRTRHTRRLYQSLSLKPTLYGRFSKLPR